MNPNTRWLAAVALIGVGLLSLMSMSLLWPMFILLPGLVMLSIALWGGRAGAAAMSIPGMLITGLGSLLFVQNWTGYWESWAYVWALFPVFFGMGFGLMGQRLEEPTVQRVSKWFVHGGFIAFAVFAVFFELFIGISGAGGSLGALVLIGLGIFLLSRDGGLGALQSGGPGKAKKGKRAADQLFTGPIVYGSRARVRETDRLVLPDDRTNESKMHS